LPKSGYRLVPLTVEDGKPGEFVIGFFADQGRLLVSGKVFRSLSSPALKQLVRSLPSGSSIYYVNDVARPSLNLDEFGAFCKTVGVEFTVLPTCG
jgi:hypothetical protein